MVLPTGTILVTTGMLNSMTNVRDQLGAVLAHEIAHVVLDHTVSPTFLTKQLLLLHLQTEMYSRGRFIDWLVIASYAGIWALHRKLSTAIVSLNVKCHASLFPLCADQDCAVQHWTELTDQSAVLEKTGE